MKKVMRIDTNGIFIGDEIIGVTDVLESTQIETEVPEGLHTPKWNGTEWVEGKTSTELLDLAKQRKIGELNGLCREEIVKGYSVPLSSTVTNEYENELHDQRNLALKGIKVMLDTAITSVNWKTVNKGMVTHTRDEFLQVVRQADTHIDSNLTKYRDKKALVKNATTITEVDSIIW